MSNEANQSVLLPLSDTSTYAAGVIQSAAFRLLKRFTDANLTDYGITTTQWFIIGTVYATGDEGIRLTELAAIVDTTLSFLTNAVNQLEVKGFLSRKDDKNDSRSKLIFVPSDKRPLVETIEQELRVKMRKDLYSAIDRDDLQTYLKVLYQLSRLQQK